MGAAELHGEVLRHFGHVTVAPSSHRSPVCDTGCSGTAGASFRVRQPLGPLGQQILQIKAAELQLAEFEPQQLRVPTRSR